MTLPKQHPRYITRPKFGCSKDENEDSLCCPSYTEIESATSVRFAISDGATESSYSKEWSQLLVDSYKNTPCESNHLKQILTRLSKEWHALVAQQLTAVNTPWYAQQKADLGAFATFLGLTLNYETKTFEALAVGDCTLFQIRNDALFLSFPLTHIDDFNNTPQLIASNTVYQAHFEKSEGYYQRHQGTIEENDVLMLASDALAAWIFKQNDAKHKPWHRLKEILFHERHRDKKFDGWLTKQRETHEIKNDDVTLLIIPF